MSKHSDNFHRLAKARIKKLNDAIRVFGNLSSPAYVWSPDEVDSYFNQIVAALVHTHGKFSSKRCWKAARPESVASPSMATVTVDEVATVPVAPYQALARIKGEHSITALLRLTKGEIDAGPS